MKVVYVAAFFVAAAAALSASDQEAVTSVIDTVSKHAKTNPQFAELKASTLLAMRSTSETGGVRSPMSEVAAMTDMMLIQCQAEINHLVKDHVAYQARCTRKGGDYATTIVQEKRTEDSNLVTAMHNRRLWESLLPEIPIRDGKIDQTGYEIMNDNDRMQAAIQRRRDQEAKYYSDLREHDYALEDVQTIKSIIQNSALDKKAGNGAQVGAGANSASVAATTALLEMKKTAHPSLLNLLELAHQAVSKDTSEGSGVDMIYKLLYSTRDTLNQSKEKVIKNEQSAVGNWRTNKVAFRNDINDLEILRHTYYKEKGTIKRDIGTFKKMEGQYKITMATAVQLKEDSQILKNFLVVACHEEASVYSRELASKRNEKSALEQVQKKLRELKWSSGVYKAVSSVSQGIVYLKGDYNIFSFNWLYLAVDGTDLVGHGGTYGDDAAQFTMVMQTDDLSYHIKYTDKDKKVSYLTEDANNNVKFARSPSKGSKWNFKSVHNQWGISVAITNVVSSNSLYLDEDSGYKVSTLKQSDDYRSEFRLEKPYYYDVGCFKQKVQGTLEYYLGSSDDNSIDSCHSKCVAKEKELGEKLYYFGLSEGKQCRCGNNFDWDAWADQSDCGIICSGRDGELCGGNFRWSIYRNVEAKPIVVKQDKVMVGHAQKPENSTAGSL